MAVLITGGYGLLGSWLAHDLADQGEDIIILDMVIKEFDYLEPVRNKIQFVRASVMNFSRLVELCKQKEGEIDGIIHTVSVMATPEILGKSSLQSPAQHNEHRQFTGSGTIVWY